MTLSQLVTVYFTLGGFLGAVVGLLRPLGIRGKVGAGAVGFAVGAIALCGFAVTAGETHISALRLAWYCLVGGSIGAGVAVRLRRRQPQSRR
jgi:hypothetical protein